MSPASRQPGSRAPAASDPVSAAFRHLKRADPVLYAAMLPHKQDLRERIAAKRRYSGKQLYAALAASVAGQQLSVKAADTIWKRLEDACDGTVTPEAIERLRPAALRAAGLSNAKVRTLLELAAAVREKRLSLTKLRTLPEDQAVAQLSSIWGIGRWTAEMFLMFALEREDVFSPGDLGLRRSMEALYGLPKEVHERELVAIAARWSPHRTLASRALWRIRDAD